MSDDLRILYVDDDPDIRTIVAMALRLDPAMTLRCAASGCEALAVLRDTDWRPDLVLLDVMMPGMDGVCAQKALRALPGLCDVPVVFMTGRGRQADIARYRAGGVTDVIIKPFDPVTLPATIRRLMARHRASRRHSALSEAGPA